MTNPWHDQVQALGAFLHTQRKLANLTLRELASMTDISNAYLSQIERGKHEPSVRVLRSIAQALDLSANTLLTQAGLLEDSPPSRATEEAIRADPVLSSEQNRRYWRSTAAMYSNRRSNRAPEEPATAGGVLGFWWYARSAKGTGGTLWTANSTARGDRDRP